MFSFKHLFISLLIVGLSLQASASAITKEDDLSFAAGQEISYRSTPNAPPEGPPAEDFVGWLASQGVSRKSRRHLEHVVSPAVHKSQSADGSWLPSRDIPANSAPGSAPVVDLIPDGPRISSRTTYGTTIAILKEEMSGLYDDDEICTMRATFGSAFPHRSLDIDKRVDHGPSICLWRPREAMVVGMGAAIYHDWASTPAVIGTKGLCGCTAVAIISQVGTIVAHISPNFESIDAQLAEIQRLYNEYILPQAQPYAYYFPPTNANGELLVEIFQDYIKQFMQKSMSLGASIMPYFANPESRDDHDGTVVVKKIAGAIALYLNDEQVN